MIFKTNSFIIKLFFFVISLPLFSQSIFENNLVYDFIDNKFINDIASTKEGGVLPIIYLNNPDFSDLGIEKKKSKFIDFILPAILIEKSKIKKAYNYVKDNVDSLPKDSHAADLYRYCGCNNTHDLLLCLKEQPTSIILAQAAIESGWGTSRFFLEGFNLFGVHASKYDKQSMQTYESEKIYVKKYNNILESIHHYLRTLAKDSYYTEFRKKRFLSNDVYSLIQYLTSYSERGEEYVKDLESIINYNKLDQYDTIKLSE